MDLVIPDVLSIPVGGGSVTSAVGGIMDLEFGGTDHLYLDLDDVTVSYVDAIGLFQIAFGGSVATIFGQSLPYGLVMGDPVTASFSTQLSSSTDDGVYLTSFTAAGTGEVTGRSGTGYRLSHPRRCHGELRWFLATPMGIGLLESNLFFSKATARKAVAFFVG